MINHLLEIGTAAMIGEVVVVVAEEEEQTIGELHQEGAIRIHEVVHVEIIGVQQLKKRHPELLLLMLQLMGMTENGKRSANVKPSFQHKKRSNDLNNI